MKSFVDRMLGAARLDPSAYEEIEHDRSAMPQAIAVVVLSSLASGFGSGFAGRFGFAGGALAALLGWMVWAGLTYLIGTKLLPTPETQADWGQLLRTIGFSATPGLLRFLGFIPFLGGLIYIVTAFWMLAAFVVAVRTALDYRSTGRAVAVCLVGWLVFVVLGRIVL